MSAMLYRGVILCLWLYLILGAFPIGNLQAQDSPPETHSDSRPTSRVLVVHSYHQEYDWVRTINEGISRGFEGSVVQVRYFYLDSKRKQKPEQIKRKATEARKLVETWQPDIIIAADDNAQAYFASKLIADQGDDAPPIIFCGVNGELEDYGYVGKNVTGVLERVHAAQAIDLLKRIQPSVESLVFVTDDSVTSDNIISYLKTLDLRLPIVEARQPSTFKEWKKTIQDLQKTRHAIALYLFYTVKDDQGEVVDSKKVIEWTQKNNKRPTVGFGPENAALCSVGHSGREHGFLTAMMALRIRAGRPASQIPVVVNRNGTVLFNLKVAEQMNVIIPYDVLKLGEVTGEMEE